MIIDGRGTAVLSMSESSTAGTYSSSSRPGSQNNDATRWVPFPATRWTRVRQCAAGDDSEAAQRALESLCRDYWLPLYAFARHAGNNREDSQDLVQGFFAKAIDDGLFGKADPAAGRLRTFLLTSFKFFQGSEYKKSKAIKRGGGWDRVNWEEADKLVSNSVGQGMSPEEEFDRQWALRMLNKALTIMERQYQATDRGAMFRELRPFLNPNEPGEAEIARLAASQSITQDAARQAVHRARERFRSTLRQLIGDTLESPAEEDVDIEVEALRRALLG